MEEQQKDTEYQLTEKGLELSKELAKKNAEKEESQAKVQESLAGKKPLAAGEVDRHLNEIEKKNKEIKSLEEKKNNEFVGPKRKRGRPRKEDEPLHRYDEARRIRNKGFANLMADKLLKGESIGGSFTKTISERTQAKITGIKEFFDPLNIAKKMTGGSRLAPALLGRLTGRSKEDIEQFAGKATAVNDRRDTASKVGKTEEMSTGMVDILTKILTLMQKTYDEDKALAEGTKNKEEEVKEEKDRKDKALLAALKEKKKKTKGESEKEEKIEKETGGGIADVIKNILDSFGGLKSGMSLLANIGKFFVSPLGLGLISLSAGAIGAWAFWKMISDPSGYDKDPNSPTNMGLAQAVRVGGLAGVKDEMDRRKKLPEYERTMADLKDAERTYWKDLDGNSQFGTDKQLEGYASRGPEAARAVEDYKKQRDLATQKSTTGTTTATPMAETPVSSGAMGETATPEDSTSSLGSQLSSVTGENLESKLSDMTDSMQEGLETVNNFTVNKNSRSSGTSQMPPVRNPEESFQRMILESTRVV